MRVSIWDIDYYCAEDKTNMFNPDAMKISSYHKQRGDQVNFVLSKDDINRPYDLFYIIKENQFLSFNPPYTFYLDNNRVRWWGEAYRSKVKWKMDNVMLSCRPDYLLYPNHNTPEERAEHLRLFNNQAQPLQLIQDYTNSYKNKIVIETDQYLWYASKKDILWALDILTKVKNLSFLNPILLKRILGDKDIKNAFLNLNFTIKSRFEFQYLKLKDVTDDVFTFIDELKWRNKRIRIIKLEIVVDYKNDCQTIEAAQNTFNKLKEIILQAKRHKINILFNAPLINETPFNFFFAALSYWTVSNKKFRSSWLTYLTAREKMNKNNWISPKTWTIGFRDLLRQTYKDRDFLLLNWGNKRIDDKEIPWKIWDEEFKLGV